MANVATNVEAVRTASAQVFLRRRGLVWVPAADDQRWRLRRRASLGQAEAVLLECAKLGYAGSHALREALVALSTEQLGTLREQLIQTLAAQLGATQRHRPLYRKFPHGIPKDTHALWVKRVLVHYFQSPEQPCLHCSGDGTTHVLRPCEHVICDRCFDGSNYSACPICNRQCDDTSPFFLPSDVRTAPKEQVRFKRLDLCPDPAATARVMLEDLCARAQALNPTDKADFTALIDDWSAELPGWLPERIPLKENVALVFGRLFKLHAPAQILPLARQHLKTATDVLRFIAAYSGADAALQGATVYDYEDIPYPQMPWWDSWAAQAKPVHVARYAKMTARTATPRMVKRFPMAKLSRALRRALLAILDGLDPHALREDMLRHRSYWVWVGEFLHPGEYRKRFPNVAGAFEIVRKKGPDGTLAPRFYGFYGALERAAARGDSRAMGELLATRPGELGRRFDHLLRVAGEDERAQAEALARFDSKLEAYSFPVLLTLHALLPTRTKRAKRRMFWPKGQVAKGVTIKDTRPTLPPALVTRARAGVEGELLRRFAAHPHFDTAIVDDALAGIMAPFNERTASPAAINLPRGSRVQIPAGKFLRMFLHWCEPKGGESTDIDLSVGFYDGDWEHVGVCSYYQLECSVKGETIARSSGDLTSAPPPKGSSEFVDLYLDEARKQGVRYAVMVVNAYSGLSFDQLERGFAGLMIREDREGFHFDPRTVALRFGLQGDNGVYTPLCVDLRDNTLHWLDIYAKGEMAFNNVENSNKSITRVCPETIDYFGSGVRANMRELGLLHAAARCRRVIARSQDGGCFVHTRRAGEDPAAFLARIRADEGAQLCDRVPELEGEVLAVLYEGDLHIPHRSSVYALFRGQLEPTLEAADLIA